MADSSTNLQLAAQHSTAPSSVLPNQDEDQLVKVSSLTRSSRPSLSQLDSISSTNSSASIQTIVAQSSQNHQSDLGDLQPEEPILLPKPKSGKPKSGKSSKSNSSPPVMKKFNALLPKFKTNKLEPLSIDPNVPSTSSDYIGPIGPSPTNIGSGKVRNSKGKKLKRANKGKVNYKKSAREPKTQETIVNMEYQQPSTSTAAMNGTGTGTGDGPSPTIQVVEVDANELRRKSKVIFAVPQYPGQPVIPIAYKLTNRLQSSNPEQSGYEPPNLNNDMHFEIVWRNLIYYHQSTLKKLKEMQASEKKVKDSAQSKSKEKKNKVKDRERTKSPEPPLQEHRRSIPRNGQPRPTLNNISGSFRSGQMTAIMGPSGAGKTVFLNCITGHLSINGRKENSGDILINGVKTIRIGFVEQFDHLLPHLTVRETLLFASRIKNAARYYLNHMKIVENVISRLDLTDCCEIYTSRCSNGQRKRLSIAIELCFNSDILILDEPTSGLDAVTGYQIMNTLKTLTKRRRAISILATIHQPNPRMFQLFDNLIVLSREGTIMYQGSPQDLPQTLLLVGLTCPMYTNISDYLLEVASGDFGRQTLHLLAHYNKEYNQMRIAEDLNEVEVTSLQEAVKRANQVNKRSFILCTWLLFIRTLICNWRNPFNSKIRIASLTFCSIFLGLVFTDVVGSVSTCPPTKYFLWRFNMDDILAETQRQQQHAQENLSIIFMIALISLFNSMLNTVVTFSEELAVFRREHDNYSYSIFSFYIAKICGDLPFTMPSTALFVVCVHRMTGQIFDMWNRLWWSILPCCMVTFIGQFIGMTMAIIFEGNMMAAIFAVVFIIIPLMLFSGFFRLLVDMSWLMAKLSWCSFLKQVINSLMIAIYGIGRCEHEDEMEREQFIARNITEEAARPSWINSMTTLIDYQMTLSDTEDPNLLALKNESMGKEEKLVRYMGLNVGSDPATTKTALILQHFNLKPSFKDYWFEVSVLSHYIVLFAIVLYVIMVMKYSRRHG